MCVVNLFIISDFFHILQAKANGLQSCVIIIRVMRDLCQRIPAFSPLSNWVRTCEGSICDITSLAYPAVEDSVLIIDYNRSLIENLKRRDNRLWKLFNRLSREKSIVDK